MYYYGYQGGYSGYGNSCCNGGYGYPYGGGYGGCCNNSGFAIVLVLFILLVIIIGTRFAG